MSSTATGGNYCWKTEEPILGDIVLFWYWGYNTKQATLSTFCNIVCVLFFVFITAYLFLWIVVLFLFGCFHLQQRNEVWVRFISIRWVIQDIGLLLYIHCVPISNNQPNFSSLYCYFSNKNWFLILNFMLAILQSMFWVYSVIDQ